ncbi:MAG TPA: hypothetical protein VM582_05500 [Candidatus Thermoplasmatota archaeon]|nr:hypothetical protein [Candidatus Thermoplasmatota archaeon]
MRGLAIVLVLTLLAPGLATVAAHHSPTHPVIHRHMTTPGWSLDSFSAPHELISFTVGAEVTGELVGYLIHVYRADGALVGGFVATAGGGREVDVVVTAGDVTLGELTPAPHASTTSVARVDFRCKVACSATRDFTVLVVAAGDVGAWGYGLFSPGGVAGDALGTGTRVGAVTTRDFEGTAAHASTRGLGVTLSSDATHAVEVQDRFVGVFGKLSWPGPAHASAQTPTGTQTCFCAIDGGPAGTYTFRYSDADAFASDGVLVWADVPAPTEP